jgi:RNA polymerase sigma-70 factor (ECF subfamily)
MRGLESSNQTNIEDLKLVARVLEGDVASFSVLVKRHHARIYSTIYSLVGHAEEAEDLAQDVFIKAFRSLTSFRGQAQFSTWIYRIAVNCSFDYLKSAQRRHQASVLPGHGNDVAVFSIHANRADMADAGVMRRELQEKLEWALNQLPDEYRITVVLREIDDLPYEEIALFLGCSVGTVKSRLFRARVLLRDLLQGHYKSWFET